jgi:hypothetical protein
MFQILFLCTTILKNPNFLTKQTWYSLHFSNKEVRKNPHTGYSIHFFPGKFQPVYKLNQELPYMNLQSYFTNVIPPPPQKSYEI